MLFVNESGKTCQEKKECFLLVVVDPASVYWLFLRHRFNLVVKASITFICAEYSVKHKFSTFVFSGHAAKC